MEEDEERERGDDGETAMNHTIGSPSKQMNITVISQAPSSKKKKEVVVQEAEKGKGKSKIKGSEDVKFPKIASKSRSIQASQSVVASSGTGNKGHEFASVSLI
jgi:hypothetical protein